MGITVGSATVQMRNAKKSQKKNNAKSCKRTKNAAEATEGRDLHNHKSTEGFREKRGFGLSDTGWMEFG